jgi:predicted Zn-dependent protease
VSSLSFQPIAVRRLVIACTSRALALGLVAWGGRVGVAHASETQERRAGCFIDQFVVDQEAVLFAPALEDRVGRIVARLQAANSLPGTFQVRILNSPIVNAYAAPGGFLYVTSGLLEFSTNADELAGVLAHEMAHVSQHHYFQEYEALQKKQDRFELFTDIVSVAITLGVGLADLPPAARSTSPAGSPSWLRLRGKPPPAPALGPAAHAVNRPDLLARGKIMAVAVGSVRALDLAGGMVLMLSVSGYHRDRELEADALAIKYTAAAGYDPRALVAALKRLALLEDRASNTREPQHVSKLINAEPGLKKRIEFLQQRLCPRDERQAPCP